MAMGGGGGMQSGLMQAGIQGVQNTSRQELMQRQALYQNMLGAMDDRQWLMQHFPNFWGWNAQGGGGGGYDAGAAAPMMYTPSNFQMPSQKSDEGNNWGKREVKYEPKPTSYDTATHEDVHEKGGMSSYSHLWS